MTDTNNDALRRHYDDIPYTSKPLPVTRPENLESIARLFGISAAPPANARILEIGGASGGNLIPTAMRFPEAECFGMDLSPVQIANGQLLIDQLGGLRNIALRAASVTDIDERWGKFDYIVCHGVFSWVPEHIRADILRVCRENLAENGIALVSFNTYPGWKAREVLRDAMMWSAESAPSSTDAVARARAMVTRLGAHAGSNPLIGAAIEGAADTIANGDEAYVQHEYLEPFNQPLYLRDFIRMAAEAKLTYLGDAGLPTMFPENYPEAMQSSLREMGTLSDQDQQQFLDYLVSRNFRHGLLVHSDRQPEMNLTVLRTMHFQGSFKVATDANGKPVEGRLEDSGGMQYMADNPVFFTLAQILSQAYPATVPYLALHRELQTRAQSDVQATTEMLDPMLRLMVVKGSVNALADAAQLTAAVSAKPLVHPFTRRQVAIQREASDGRSRYLAWSLLHNELELDAFGAWLVTQLDGSTDVNALADRALHAVENGEAIIPPEAGNVTRQVLLQQIPHSLEHLRRNGLLSA